jgi:hypothetical protein
MANPLTNSYKLPTAVERWPRKEHVNICNSVPQCWDNPLQLDPCSICLRCIYISHHLRCGNIFNPTLPHLYICYAEELRVLSSNLNRTSCCIFHYAKYMLIRFSSMFLFDGTFAPVSIRWWCKSYTLSHALYPCPLLFPSHTRADTSLSPFVISMLLTTSQKP